MIAPALKIEELEASIGSLPILKGVDLAVPFGEIHALMGPNGSGKSTLCHALSGHADYTVQGSAQVAGHEILGRPVDERAQTGLFQAFQYPVEIPGVALRELIGEAATAEGEEPVDEFWGRADEVADRLGMRPFLDRAVNQDLSGGEKKRSEIFQMAVLDPKVAVLDEPDSGLDIDAVREVAEMVESLRNPGIGILLITHYSRILRYLSADRVHVMMQGRVVRSGGPELAEQLEEGGYEGFRQELGIEPESSPAPQPLEDPFADMPFEP